MKIVADTNTFLAVALDEPERSNIIALTARHTLIAPEILPYEAGNALTSLVKRKVLSHAEVKLAWSAIQAIAVELQPVDISSALNLAIQYNLYAYDAYFLECALRLRVPLLTLDKEMKRVAKALGIQVLE
jgi:predicted nucleic acid-binding protein